ncbi:cyanophycinase [Alishewanella sp. SMS8]|uniref:cyanophycinase n=1 Tax=Alishewanella sp. SMS8 TaxID=2994676 RepID=UPI0027418F41|nr:cyanophycinase [Alishewanella sp. SMS8]MDP5037207.1 cyanophycinase [Alishewanella sp.]MDP5459299.1 cyanophycinase [Alishewanella sp. SMS8]
MRFSCISLFITHSLLYIPMLLCSVAIGQEQDLPASTTPLSAQQTILLPDADYDLMLVGGGLATCSSMSEKSCSDQTQFSKLAKTSNAYLLHPTTLQLFSSAELFTAERASLQQQLVTLFNNLTEVQGKLLTESQLIEQWRSFQATEALPSSGEELWQQLSDRELNAVLDFLEVPTLSADGKYRLTEQVDLAETTDFESAELYRQFVQLATKKAQAKGRQQAKVLVVTASSRDPFAAVDFYLDAFRQAGAAAQWLPLTAALQHAITDKNCVALPQYLANIHGSYRREQIYADLFNLKQQLCKQGSSAIVAMIADADGIFFNGGDQSLTYQALRHNDGSASAELLAILEAVKQKRLLVGGTSAGTAVMSGSQFFTIDTPSHAVPMISNGDSYHALQYGAKAAIAPWPGCRKEQRCPDDMSERQLTYTATGGLGLFPLGILDTHFAERGRQARLLVLQQASQTKLAFGIDEATALLVDLSMQAEGIVQLKASGAAEVYISELLPESSPAQLLANTYSMSAGDTVIWQQGNITLIPTEDKTKLVNSAEPLQSKSPLFSRDYYRSLSHSLCLSNFNAATVSEPPYLIRVSKVDSCYQSADSKLSAKQRLRIITEQQ